VKKRLAVLTRVCQPLHQLHPLAHMYCRKKKSRNKTNSILLAVKHIARHLSQHLAIVFAHVVDLLHQ
jgi:hypothetical protein